MRTAICSVIIDDDGLLLVRKKETWITPGGKPEPGEDDLSCLSREIAEELSGTRIKDVRHYLDIPGRSPHVGDIINVKYYFAALDGPLGKPSNEINAVEFVREASRYQLSDSTSQLVDCLRRDGYL